MPEIVIRDEDADYENEVSVSYAGDDSKHVEPLLTALKDKGLRFFDYKDVHANALGEKLDEELGYIYEDSARYCVVFLSRLYAEKAWPKFELRSAKARAARDNGGYILLYRIDDTRIPCFMRNIIYADHKETTAAEFAEQVISKVLVPDQPSRKMRREVRRKRRFWRHVREAVASVIAVSALLWGSLTHIESRTAVRPRTPDMNYIRLRVWNTGYKWSMVSNFRLKIDGFPAKDESLRAIGCFGTPFDGEVPGWLGAWPRLLPTKGEWIPLCQNGRRPAPDEMESRRVTLQFDVRESNDHKETLSESLNARELHAFLDNWIPDGLPPCD